MTKRRARLYLVLLFLAALGVAATLTLMALKDNIAYFRSPTEVASGVYPEQGTGRSFRLGGMVEAGSVKRDHDMISFRVTDFQNAVPVRYRGVVPDLFREGQGVVVEGKIEEGKVFVARQLLAKHDEKYVPPEVAKAMQGKTAP